ncbi:MAG: hypothetical protein R3283_00910 [Balneolaceae bacterium]|nr:hypothetical protein [Balneolaceae bacterium]
MQDDSQQPDHSRNRVFISLISIIGGFSALWIGYESLDPDAGSSLLQAYGEPGSFWPMMTFILGLAFMISGVTGILRGNG